MFDRDTIREVRQRTDLVQLIDEFVPLRRKGARHFGRCPFHQEKTASFSVSADVGLYFCFGCKATGDAVRGSDGSLLQVGRRPGRSDVVEEHGKPVDPEAQQRALDEARRRRLGR